MKPREGGRNESLEIKKNNFLQKRSVRIIENAKIALHTDPLLFTYKILKLNYLTEFNQATFMSKYTKNLLPSLFNNIFKKFGNFELSN